MDREELLKLQSHNASLNELLMQEAANVARQYEELKAEMAIQKEKEQEMIKMSSLQIRTIENLLKKIRDLETQSSNTSKTLRKEKTDAVEKLEKDLEYKEQLIQTLQQQVIQQEKELNELHEEHSLLKTEKEEADERMRKAQSVFRHTDITPIYEQVLDLFTQFYPEEDNIVQFLVNNNPDTPKGEVPVDKLLPDILARGDESVSHVRTPLKIPEIANTPTIYRTPLLRSSMVSIGVQVDLGIKEHSIPKPSFISKINQEAYSRTLPTPIMDMRKSIEEETTPMKDKKRTIVSACNELTELAANSGTMSSKEITQVFVTYQKSRIAFVQTIAELVKQPRNIEAMMQRDKDTGVMELLRPLLLDTEPSVQQSAAMALGRLANYSEQLAERVVTSEILPQLVYSLSNDNKYYKRSAAFVLRSVATHSPVLAQAVVDSGAVEALVECLSQFDPGVKEAAAWALGNIAKHNGELAQAVVDQDSIPLLLLCVKEPEMSLKKVAASALAHICSHSPELAQAVVDAEGIPDIAPLIENSKVKRQACACLSHIAKHSVELAELVVEGEIFPKIFALLKDPEDPVVRKNAATCIREIAKHTPELSLLIVNAGGLPAIVDYVSQADEDSKLPGIMTLGFISAFTEIMASNVIKAKAIGPLGYALSTASSDHVKAAAAWTLGQIGRHSSDHARAVAEGNIFPKLMDAYLSPKASDDLKAKAKRALKFVIQKCVYLDALNPLLHEKAPQNILKYVVKQYAKVLPNDVEAKKKFAEGRGLAKLQLIQTDDNELMETIKLINTCYPEEVVKYYSPGYDKELLGKINDEL